MTTTPLATAATTMPDPTGPAATPDFGGSLFRGLVVPRDVATGQASGKRTHKPVF
jgi:hypothetical protein